MRFSSINVHGSISNRSPAPALTEYDHCSAETAAGESGTVRFGVARGDRREAIDVGQRYLEVISHRGMRFEKQLAKRCCVAAAQRIGSGKDARVFGHDVARPTVEWLGQALDTRQIIG
jgi:hypothetical protein